MPQRKAQEPTPPEPEARPSLKRPLLGGGAVVLLLAALGFFGNIDGTISLFERVGRGLGLTEETPAPTPQTTEVAPANPNDVAPLVDVEGVEGQDLKGQILLQNRSSRSVTLFAYRYNAYGGHISTRSKQVTIPAYQSFPINLEERNNLVTNGRLDVWYDFAFVGEEVRHQGKASFVIPEQPKAGEQIGADECCESENAVPLDDAEAAMEDQLLQPKGHLTFVAHDSEGQRWAGSVPHQLIVFDPVQRNVLFLSGPPGNQVALVSGMARNPRGEHVIQVLWDVERKVYQMAVDGRPARRATDEEIGQANKPREAS